MGKVAVGCLAVILVVAVAGGGIVWFKVIKPGMDFAGGVVELGKELQEIDRSVRDRSPYLPPENGALSGPQLERFLSAQAQIRTQMEGRLDELNEKYSDLNARLKEAGKEAGLSDIAGAYRDLGDLLLDAKRAQVEALNANEFSLQEYAWVRQQTFMGLGESVGAFSAVEGMSEQPRTVKVPPETVELVTPHREALMETYALAWWGL